MQERERGQGRISLWKKKKAAPFLRCCCYGPAGFTTDGSESHPRASLWSCPLKHTIRIPHIPLAPRLRHRAARPPRRPADLSPRGAWAKPWGWDASRRPTFSPPDPSPFAIPLHPCIFPQLSWDIQFQYFTFWEFESLGESSLLTGGSVLDTANFCILALAWIRVKEKTAP